MHEHHAPLYRFAFSMTRNESDAADLVQEVFMRWAERGHQLQDPTKVKSWLFTTLYREARARTRRLVRFPHQPIEQVEPELPEIPAPTTERMDGLAVVQALQQVDPLYRDALALFYLDDTTYAEIATILEVPLGTVKSRIARGVAQLQRIFSSPPSATPAPPTTLGPDSYSPLR